MALKRQRVYAVLSTMDFADFPLRNSCIFGTEKNIAQTKVCAMFLVPRVKTKLNFRVPQGLLFLPYRWRCI